jgi:hypothetical protein
MILPYNLYQSGGAVPAQPRNSFGKFCGSRVVFMRHSSGFAAPDIPLPFDYVAALSKPDLW